MSVEFCWETEMEGKIIDFDPKLKEGKIKAENGTLKKFNMDQWFEEYLPEKGMVVVLSFDKEKKLQKIKRFTKFKNKQSKKQSSPKYFEWQEPLDFVMRREDKPKYGVVFNHYKKIEVSSESPSAGKEKLKEIVKKNGGNALLSLTVEKKTGSRGTSTGGTYYYTYFNVSGNPAFIASKRKSDKDNLEQSQSKLKLKGEKFIEQITEYYNPYTESGLWEKDSDLGKLENIVRGVFGMFK